MPREDDLPSRSERNDDMNRAGSAQRASVRPPVFRDTARLLCATRVFVAWAAVGCATGAYEQALAYAQQREQFGKPIAAFQLVQDLLVKMLSNITASQCMVVRLSQLQDEGKLKDEHASLAKAFCRSRCARPSVTPVKCSAPTACCWTTRLAALSRMPRRSPHMRAHARYTRSLWAEPLPASTLSCKAMVAMP